MKEWNKELVLYRLTRAHETLDARLLANAGRWNACVNRLYYACFYAISALLVRNSLSSSKHAGVRGFFTPLPGRTRPSYCFSKRYVPIEGIF